MREGGSAPLRGGGTTRSPTYGPSRRPASPAEPRFRWLRDRIPPTALPHPPGATSEIITPNASIGELQSVHWRRRDVIGRRLSVGSESALREDRACGIASGGVDQIPRGIGLSTKASAPSLGRPLRGRPSDGEGRSRDLSPRAWSRASASGGFERGGGANPSPALPGTREAWPRGTPHLLSTLLKAGR